jgi:O-antigen ligase
MMSLAYAALWIFVFSVPWELVVMIPGVGVASKITGMLALAAAVMAAVLTGQLRRWRLFHVAAMLFVLCAAFELFVFHAAETLPNKFWTFVQLFLMLFIVWELARSFPRIRGLLMAYVSGAYVAAFGTILLFRREGEALRRFAAGGGDANDLAMRMALALPMAWYLAITSRKPLIRWICRGYLVVGLLAIGLTGSRGGMIATVVALSIVPLTMTKLTPARLASALCMLALAGGLAVTFVPDKIVQRLATTGSEVEDAHFGGRFKLWVAGLHAFAQKPVFGYGTAGFKGAITPELGGAAQVAHDSFISLLVEEGLVGLLLYLTMLGAVLGAVLQMPRLERRFGMVLMATLLVAMLPLTWEDHKAVWTIMAVLVGLSNSHLGAGAAWPKAVTATPVVVTRSRPVRPRQPVVVPRGSAQRGDAGA